MNYPISVINDLLHIFQLVNVAATAELYLLNIVTVTVWGIFITIVEIVVTKVKKNAADIFMSSSKDLRCDVCKLWVGALELK